MHARCLRSSLTESTSCALAATVSGRSRRMLSQFGSAPQRSKVSTIAASARAAATSSGVSPRSFARSIEADDSSKTVKAWAPAPRVALAATSNSGVFLSSSLQFTSAAASIAIWMASQSAALAEACSTSLMSTGSEPWREGAGLEEEDEPPMVKCRTPGCSGPVLEIGLSCTLSAAAAILSGASGKAITSSMPTMEAYSGALPEPPSSSSGRPKDILKAASNCIASSRSESTSATGAAESGTLAISASAASGGSTASASSSVFSLVPSPCWGRHALHHPGSHCQTPSYSVLSTFMGSGISRVASMAASKCGSASSYSSQAAYASKSMSSMPSAASSRSKSNPSPS
mmetsp:Transcript_63583/g.151677  ORF Transcript_63583/g.151677 Transcript_63583/m.151677 type:complete len:345 (-) Transcript_63583:326-1360(-)